MEDLVCEIDDCVTAPLGFRAGTVACGIKSDGIVQDLAILVSDIPCVAAGTFTTSTTPAAPVMLCQERLQSGRAQAIIVNSGNANCATGDLGLLNAYRMTEFVARKFQIANELVLCSSTGIIGRQLPIEKIEAGVKDIALSTRQGDAFSEAIMTTDTRPKRIALEFEVDGRIVRLGGVTKGAGMIYPNMATMLCYLTTDAAVEHDWLQSILRETVADTFNMISIDGDMSTNDTCIIFANGLAGNLPLNHEHPEALTFRMALRYVMTYLAREVARDGEGATRLMTVHVRGALSKADAVKAARAVTLSPIWQCALAGGDPNWGRIVAALGASGCVLDQNRYDIFIGDVQVARHGIAALYDLEQARAAMAGKEVTITIDLQLVQDPERGQVPEAVSTSSQSAMRQTSFYQGKTNMSIVSAPGEGQATAWGCDLTYGYIDENTLYTR